MTSASLLRRLGAILYDGFLIFAIIFAASIPIVAVRGDVFEPYDPAYRALVLGIAYLFYVTFWYRYGRTLGMQSWGIRIETPERGQPTLAQCSIRYVVAFLSWIPAGMGYWWQLFDRDNLSWHDRASGTRLIYYPKDEKDAHSDN